MLSGILNSDRAIAMNIAIMRAFVGIRRILIKQQDVTVKLDEIKSRLEEHDAQLNQIYMMQWKISWTKRRVKENGMSGTGLGLSSENENV